MAKFCVVSRSNAKLKGTKYSKAGRGGERKKKKEKRKEERRKNKRPELWVTAVQIFFASKAEFFAEPPKSHNPPPLRLSHLPTGGRRRRHGGWRRGVRDRGADLREDHPRRGVRRPDRLLRPPDQPPRHSYPFQIPPHPVLPPPPPSQCSATFAPRVVRAFCGCFCFHDGVDHRKAWGGQREVSGGTCGCSRRTTSGSSPW